MEVSAINKEDIGGIGPEEGWEPLHYDHA